MPKLEQKKCKACSSDTPPLEGDALEDMAAELEGNWKIVNEHHIEKEFTFKNFKEALAFTNKVGAIAEEEGHHPDIHLSYGRVRLVLWTHKINGLAENDFILAAKIDQL